MANTINCPFCGTSNPDPVPNNRCHSCGAKVIDSVPPASNRGGEIAQRYRPQEGFSVQWCAISIGVVGILTAGVIVGLPMVVPALDFEGSAGMLLAIPVWFVAGVLVGLISPGRTVAEPVIATFLVAMPTAFQLFSGQTVKTMPAFMYVLMSTLGVLFSLIGSYAGERIQLGPPPPRHLD